jgi:hypothetical protein
VVRYWERAGLGGISGMAKRKGRQIMDAKFSEKTAPAAAPSGLDVVRTRAHRQKQVRLTRTDAPPDALNLRASAWHNIRSLKVKSSPEPEPEIDEPWLLAKLWADFQEFIGNR